MHEQYSKIARKNNTKLHINLHFYQLLSFFIPEHTLPISVPTIKHAWIFPQKGYDFSRIYWTLNCLPKKFPNGLSHCHLQSYFLRTNSALRYRISQRYWQEQLLQCQLSHWELVKSRLDTSHPKWSCQPQSGPHLPKGLVGLKIFLLQRSAQQSLNFSAGRNARASSGKRGTCMFVTLYREWEKESIHITQLKVVQLQVI